MNRMDQLVAVLMEACDQARAGGMAPVAVLGCLDVCKHVLLQTTVRIGQSQIQPASGLPPQLPPGANGR